MFYGPLDDEDARLTQLSDAWEFIWQMLRSAQYHNRPMPASTIAKLVWRKYRLKMKVPALLAVPDYNAWLYHQNSTKCASEGNLLLHPEVSVCCRFWSATRVLKCDTCVIVNHVIRVGLFFKTFFGSNRRHFSREVTVFNGYFRPNSDQSQTSPVKLSAVIGSVVWRNW